MPHRSSSRRAWVLAATLAATGGAAPVGRAQQVGGSVGVSLTILEPIAAAQPRITSFDVGRDGIARIETSLPASPRTSQLVMVRISSAATALAPEPQPPALVPPSSGVRRARYLVNVGRDRRADRDQTMERRIEDRMVQLRLEYLIVAGT